MMDAATYKRLVREAPEAVMVRMVLEHALEPDAVDEVFEQCCEDPYTRTLLFSSVVGLMTLVVWDADLEIISDLYCSEDSYLQERRMVLDLLENVQPDELWIADRNFCAAASLWQIRQSGAFFIIRGQRCSPSRCR